MLRDWNVGYINGSYRECKVRDGVCSARHRLLVSFEKWRLARRLKELEEENRRLKNMYAELSLDLRDLEGHCRKKALRPTEKRVLVDYAMSEHQASLVRGCRVMSISRSSYRYQPDTAKDLPVIKALQQLAETHPRWGLRLMFDRLRNDGHRWNHKRVHRIYTELKLNLRRKGKKRLPSRNPGTDSHG